MRSHLPCLCAVGALLALSSPVSAFELPLMAAARQDATGLRGSRDAGWTAAKPKRKAEARKKKASTGKQAKGKGKARDDEEEDEEDQDDSGDDENGAGGKRKSGSKTAKTGTKRDSEKSEDSDDTKDDEDRIDSSDIFGFVEGSDTGDKGDRTLFFDALPRLSRRDGDFAALRSTMGVAYTVTEGLNLSIGLTSEYEQHSRVADLAGTRTDVSEFRDSSELRGSVEDGTGLRSSLAFGLSASAKYRIVERGDSPVGVAVQLTPYWERASEAGGTERSTYGAELRLIADAALVPERLFAALNLAYTPEVSRSDLAGASERTSHLEAAGALAMRVADSVLIGAELRYRTRYEGSFFEDLSGWALFAGPTLHVMLSDSASIGAAWSVQVAGRSAEEPDRNLDLVHHERHQLRIKSSFTF